jgi:hypothetical protein
MEIVNNHLTMLLVTTGFGILLFSNHRWVIEAIEAFRNNFPRGGPPAPMHPSPSGDDIMFRRRRAKRNG